MPTAAKPRSIQKGLPLPGGVRTRHRNIPGWLAAGRAFPSATKSAFTLIDLLVVIAIVAILAGLLMGSLAMAKLLADSAVCKNNLRQLGLGAHMYLDQFHAYVPWATDTPDSPRPGASVTLWHHSLEPYVGAQFPEIIWRPDGRRTTNGVRGVWVCPGYNRAGALLNPPRCISSYGYNLFGAWSITEDLSVPNPRILGLGCYTYPIYDHSDVPVRETDVLEPSDMIQFADAVLLSGGSLGTNTVGGSENLSAALDDFIRVPLLNGNSIPPEGSGITPLALRAQRRRHGARWNVEFCDGHIENLRTQNLLDTRNSNQRRRWNRDHEPHPEIGSR